jgi:hypothetical protein
MHVVRHYDGGVQPESFSIIVQTVLQDGISGFWREGFSIILAERYEYGTLCFW